MLFISLLNLIPFHSTPTMSLAGSLPPPAISFFFEDLEKQFIGACAFFVTRNENFICLAEESQVYITDNYTDIVRLSQWVQDASIDIGPGFTEVAAFVVGTAKSAFDRNLTNHINLRLVAPEVLLIEYNGKRRQIHR